MLFLFVEGQVVFIFTLLGISIFYSQIDIKSSFINNHGKRFLISLVASLFTYLFPKLNSISTVVLKFIYKLFDKIIENLTKMSISLDFIIYV